MAAKCKYKELDSHLNEQFINSLNDGMMMECIRELTSIVDTSSVRILQVLAWARRVETQRIQITMLDS